MKRFLFCIAMLFCMCMTMNAQGLKTYSGVYRANAHFLLGTQKATYTYKTAEDGTRIYEGNFTYSCTTNPNLYKKVTGRFHDDCKEGLWTYTDKSSETKTLKINFKGGYRDGIYEYTYTTSKGTIKESLKTTMKNGVMVGAVSGCTHGGYDFQISDYGGVSSRVLLGKCVFNGQTDEDGLADGTWKLTASSLVFYDKWEHGILKECYYIDDTTGDKIKCERGIPSIISDIIRYAPLEMERMIDRGSEKPWENGILDKEEADEIKTKVMDSDEVYQTPKTDYGGYSTDEEFIQAKSTIPNILYKLNGTKVDCIIDKQGNVTDIEFKQAPKDPAVAKELERCLGLLKYKPAIYKLFTVYCKWGFWYDGNKSLLSEETNEQSPDVETKKEVEDQVFTTVEQMPSFPGGQSAINSYLSNHLQCPAKPASEGIQRVIVAFIVEKDGSISNVEIERSVEKDLDDEALRVVRNMPNWNPGKQNGAEVRVKMVIPITFHII